LLAFDTVAWKILSKEVLEAVAISYFARHNETRRAVDRG
jgi:hypothetical protein